ncbi:MAG: hypothetical protein IPJ13_30515 [Saprospiraceae bacterium]|nr:hypothetical protein [Saprospiraceae bacterium]
MTINILSATTSASWMCMANYTQQTISEGQNTINLSALPTGILIFVVGDRS